MTINPLRDKLIVVIDDDAPVLDGTGGLLKSWGCRVVTAESDQDALASLDRNKPDLIISDFHLKDGRTGIDAVAQLRNAFNAPIPAFLISGDILPERSARSAGRRAPSAAQAGGPDDIANNDVPAFNRIAPRGYRARPADYGAINRWALGAPNPILIPPAQLRSDC